MVLPQGNFLFFSEEAAVLGGPQIMLGEPWSQLGGPRSQLGGPWIPLEGLPSRLGEPLRGLQRWNGLGSG